MRSIRVPLELTVRLVADAWADDLLMALYLHFDSSHGHGRQ
jgi:hypothetical protein